MQEVMKNQPASSHLKSQEFDHIQTDVERLTKLEQEFASLKESTQLEINKVKRDVQSECEELFRNQNSTLEA
jgi:hypothetical protein